MKRSGMSSTTSEPQPIKLRVGVSTGRDLEHSRNVLGAWLAAKLPGATAVEVVSLDKPSNGASSETYFMTADVRHGRDIERREYVLRFKPDVHRLFLRDNFEEQFRLLTYLRAETNVPVPAIPFFEPDASILGGAFWVMERIEGRVPPDVPPYNAAGFLFEASVEQQRRLWLSGLEAAGKLARVDWRKIPKIVDLRPGESGLDENLRHWMDSMEWASEGKPSSLLLRTADWLLANKPSPGATGLSWGDCRIGNMIFRDFECAALIDWETITLAGAQLDLAHWLVMDEVYTVGLDLPRLPGFVDRDAIIAQWEAFSGLVADQIAWHEVMTSFRLTVITTRGLGLKSPEERARMSFEDGETMMSVQLRRALARAAPDLAI